jgi:hypothetical protein
VNRCPHCGALARIERSSGALRWRCGVCGGPIVPTEEGVARSDGELASLVRAQRARAMAVGWIAGAVVLGAVGVMGVGLALLLWLASHVVAGVLGVLAVCTGLLAAYFLRRARRRDTDARVAVDDAWELVAGEVLAARGGETTAAELAKAMQTDEDHAQSLLGRLSARGRVRVDVREDAELAYRAENAAAGDGAAGDAAAADASAEDDEAGGPRLRAR